MNIFAKGHKYNPLTKEEKEELKKRDARPVWEQWEEISQKYGISEMSDEELSRLWDELPRNDERIQPIRVERSKRANAQKSIEQQYQEAPESYWN